MRRHTRAELRTAYGVLALVDTALAAAPGRWRHARLLTKPLLMPALAAGSAHPPALTAAQTLSWGGDVALLRHDERSFMAGLGSFLGAHLAYIAAFRGRSSSPLLGTRGRRSLLAAGAVTGAGMALAAARKDRKLAAPVAVYGLTLATMATAAAAIDPSKGRRRVLTGAALFMLSDTLLGLRTFVLDSEDPRVEGAVMASYTAAQWLIADGLSAS